MVLRVEPWGNMADLDFQVIKGLQVILDFQDQKGWMEDQASWVLKVNRVIQDIQVSLDCGDLLALEVLLALRENQDPWGQLALQEHQAVKDFLESKVWLGM